MESQYKDTDEGAESYARIAGRYTFKSVTPAPEGGPFPDQVAQEMGITLTESGALKVHSPGPNSNVNGTFLLGRRAGTVVFDSGEWSEMAFDLDADDPASDLRRKGEDAEGFLQKVLSPNHAYDVMIQNAAGAGTRFDLILKDQTDSTILVFTHAGK